MKIILFACFLSALIIGSLCVTGIDIANAVTAANWACLKNNGYTFGIVRAYRSTGSLDSNAANNLRYAKTAGFTTDVYMFPCRGKSATTQVDQLITGVPGDLYSTIWIDVETNPSSGCSWSGHDSASNCAFLTETINRIKTKGKKVGVYSSSSQWQTIFGSASACAAAGSEPLWYAHYDNSPSFADFKAFAGWTKPAIKQFAGDITVCGVDLDKNWHP